MSQKGKKFKVGLIRVLTCEDPEVLYSHQRQIMEKFPELEVETKCIPDQPEGIHSPELGRIAVPKIVETAKTFQDVDMIIVSCADDPGVREIREALPGIPVTGGGETTVAVALRYGSRIGVLGITDYAPDAYARLLQGKMILEKPEGVDSTGSDDAGGKRTGALVRQEAERKGGGSDCPGLYRACDHRHCPGTGGGYRPAGDRPGSGRGAVCLF